jgi:glycine/D-amino acid oxidase-like deaminating enzyme
VFHDIFLVKFSAIIGAGIGGASTAHFLRKDFGSDADITIFEKGQVGFQLSAFGYQQKGSLAKNFPIINKSFKKLPFI